MIGRNKVIKYFKRSKKCHSTHTRQQEVMQYVLPQSMTKEILLNCLTDVIETLTEKIQSKTLNCHATLLNTEYLT